MQGSLRAAPVTSGDSTAIYAASGGIFAVHTGDGSELWRSEVFSPVGELMSPEIVVTGEIAIVLHLRTAIAFRLADGQRAWSFTRDEDSTRLLARGYTLADAGVLYAGGNGGRAYLVDIASGALLTESMLDHTPLSFDAYHDNLIVAQTWTDDDSQITTSAIVALDSQSLATLWRSTTTRGTYAFTRPAIIGDIVFAGLQGTLAGVVATDLRDGSLAWESESFPVHTMLATEVGIFVNDGSRIRRIDADSGNLMWTTELELGSSLSGQLVHHRGLLYHAHAGALVVLEAETGEILFSGPVENDYVFQVAKHDDVVLVQRGNGLSAIEPFSRDELDGGP